MFERAPEWISRSPRIRKVIVKIWRAFLRVERATIARAVLVARRDDDCVFAVATPSGAFGLPFLELDGWEPVGTQVQAWVKRILSQPSELKLQLIDGTPGRRRSRLSIRLRCASVVRQLITTGLRLNLRPQLSLRKIAGCL